MAFERHRARPAEPPPPTVNAPPASTPVPPTVNATQEDWDRANRLIDFHNGG